MTGISERRLSHATTLATSDADPGDDPRRSVGTPAIRDLLLVTAATLAAFLLRYSLALRSGLSIDEAQPVGIATLPTLSEAARFLARHDSHPPLFYAIVRGWITLSGSSDTALVLLPAALGALLVPALYWAGRTMASPLAGLAAAVLGVLAAAPLEYATLLRPYAVLPVLALVSTCFLWGARARRGRATWAGYVAASALMLWLHAWSLVFLAAQWLVALTYATVHGEWRFVSRLIGAGAIAAGLYLPWVPYLLNQVRSVGYPGLEIPFPYRLALAVIALGHASLGLERGVPTFARYSFAVAAAIYIAWTAAHLGVIAMVGRRGSERRADGRSWAASLLLAVPVTAATLAAALAAWSNLLHERCFVMLAPLPLLALGWGIAEIARASRPAFAAVLAAFVGGYLIWPIQGIPRKSNARELAAAISASARPGDLLLEVPGYRALALDRYFPADHPQLDYPVPSAEPITRYDRYWERLAAPAALETARTVLVGIHARGRGVWLISDRRFVASRWLRELGARPALWQIEAERTQQLRAYLDREYGRPGTPLYVDVGAASEQLAAIYYSGRAVARRDPAPGGPQEPITGWSAPREESGRGATRR